MSIKSHLKKFSLALLCVCSFVLVFIAMGTISVSAAEHTSHSGYTAWSNSSGLPSSSGTYYLNTNVTASADSSGYVKIYAGTTLNLCLNGKTVTLRERIWVDEGATLNICDCGTGGSISANLGGAGAIIVKGNFSMTSGTVSNTGAGRGVHSHSTGVLNISGGTISTKSYAILNSGTLYLSGSPTISSTNGSALCVSGGTVYPHSPDGTVRYSGSPLAINDWTPMTKDKVIITNATPDDLNKFSYSPGGFQLGFGTGTNANNLVLCFDFAGHGTENDPYLVSSEAELKAAITSADNDVNHIKLLDSIEIVDGAVSLKSTDRPAVVDLNGKMLTFADYGLNAANTATFKNGKIETADTAPVLKVSGETADVTLEDLTVTSATASPLVLVEQGRLTVNRCTLTNTKGDGYAVHLKTVTSASYTVYCTMTNVTLNGGAGVLKHETIFSNKQTIFCTVDGVNVTSSMTEKAYHTHQDADHNCTCDWGKESMHVDGNADTLCDRCGLFASAHSHNICGGACTHAGHSAVVYSPLTQEMVDFLIANHNGIIPAGNYALVEDITTSGLTVDSGVAVSLCLNGKKLYFTDMLYNRGGTLAICDDGAGGELIFAKALDIVSGTVNLYSGTVKKAESTDQQAPISVSGICNVYGGAILGGTATGEGAIKIFAVDGAAVTVCGGQIDSIYHDNTALAIGTLVFDNYAGTVAIKAKQQVQGQALAICQNGTDPTGISLSGSTGWQLKNDTLTGRLSFDHTAHSGGNAPTCTQKSVCDVCDQPYGDFGGHTGTATRLASNENGTHDVLYTCCDELYAEDAGCTVYDADADCTTAEHCACGYVLTVGAAAHDFSGAHLSDAEGHWHKCLNCDVTDAKQEHDMGEDNVCDACGYEKEVGPVENDADGLSGGAVTAIVAGSAVVAAGGGLSLFWFVIKKRSWADLLAIFKK